MKKTKNNPKVINENFKLHKSLKDSTYSSSKNRLRKQLPKKNQRLLSGFIHAKGMDKTNDLIVKTIGRPQAIIIGSLFAFLSVLTGTILSRYYGYSFNYLLLFIFYLIGYFLEVFIEIIIGFFVKSND